MRGLLLQIRRQIDDRDRFERTFLHTNTATDAQLLTDRRNLIGRRHLNAQLARTHHRTGSFALLIASLRLALVLVDDRDSRQTLLGSGHF